jgi:hypothetical protein
LSFEPHLNDLLVVDRRRLLFGKERHGPRSATAIFEDLYQFTPDLAPRIREVGLAKDETVGLWTMDEMHFQQYGSRCRMWVPPEIKDPALQHRPTRKSVGYFGAVRLKDGKFLFAREHDRFNAETTWEFLRLLHSRNPLVSYSPFASHR